MATSFIVAAFAIGGQSEAKERAKANAALAARADLKAEGANQTAAAAASAAAEANRRLAAAGKPTVSIPSVTVTPPPPAVTEGLSGKQLIAVQSLIENALAKYQPAMSQAQIKQAATVAASLIPKPKDGHTPTAAELLPLVTAAHTAYCSDGRCEGKTGPPGPAGPSGAPGADASPVTDDQLRPLILSALTAYCEGQPDNDCVGAPGSTGSTGPTGPTGPVGPSGPQGKYFAGMDCIQPGDSDPSGTPGQWRYYIRDPVDNTQTTHYTDGPCSVLNLPGPDRTTG